MRIALICVLAVAGAGCGSEIGDSCIVSSDCSPNGDRQCDPSSPEGYCTVIGCDFDTCPEEAACVRFFTGDFANRPCDPQQENITEDRCSLDELCAIKGHCVPRASEVRYCMRTCSSDDDCRSGYECRDLERMIANGGEPVLSPGTIVDDNAPKFCAAAPP